MWREYAGAECGVRIQMKSYPFKQYSVSNESLNKLSSEAVLNTSAVHLMAFIYLSRTLG